MSDHRWCCNGNAEECRLCTDPNPPYPFLCPGHDDTPENRAALATPPSAPVDRAELRERIRRACAEADGFRYEGLEPHDYQKHASAVLAVLPADTGRAAVLREAADALASVPHTHVLTELRRMADEAQQADSARRVLTPDEYSTAWHAIEGAAGEPGACPGTVLATVLHALRIDAPAAEAQQAGEGRRPHTPSALRSPATVPTSPVTAPSLLPSGPASSR